MTDPFPILSLLIFLPLLGGLILLPLHGRPVLARWLALAIVGVEFVLVALVTLQTPEQGTGSLPGGFFLMENRAWIPQFGIRYLLGIDGISLLMTGLTAVVTPLAMLVSWRAIRERAALHFALLLILEGALMGVFLSLDLILFYLFWELMLLPVFLIILIWGSGRPVYSALKFFIITIAGSLLMLLAIIGLHLVHAGQTGVATFALPELLAAKAPTTTGIWLFAAFLLAFAIKIPLFPLHTWLPDAYADAPAAGTIMLSAVLSKTGAYALIRFGFPLFPDAARAVAPLLLVVAVISIIYAAWLACAQTDLKRLFGYASISHMGFVALGIAVWRPVALSGSVLQMVNHGVISAALFALAGMMEERTGSREIPTFGGIWGRAPLFSVLFLLFVLTAASLPGFNIFVGEFLILTGAFRVTHVAVVIAFLGAIIPLIYTVRIVQEILFGEPRDAGGFPDLGFREGIVLGLLLMLDIWLGIHPAPLLDLIKGPVALLVGVTP